jgi:hypothetical protein
MPFYGLDMITLESNTDMAMELKSRVSVCNERSYQPDARVVCTESQDNKPIGLDLNDVSTHRILRECQLHGIIVRTVVFFAPIDDLKDMTVKVDYWRQTYSREPTWMFPCISVINDDLHHIIMAKDKGIC